MNTADWKCQPLFVVNYVKLHLTALKIKMYYLVLVFKGVFVVFETRKV